MVEPIIFSRVFNAPKELVWKAWTEPEMVKKWWGPQYFTSPSAKIDLQVGGKYIFCMHGPAGTEFDKDLYSAGEYKEIVPMEKLVVTDYFSDEEGNKVNPTTVGMSDDMPDEMYVTVTFDEVEDGKTKLSIMYQPESDEQRAAMISSGMQEGWDTSLDKIEEALK